MQSRKIIPLEIKRSDSDVNFKQNRDRNSIELSFGAAQIKLTRAGHIIFKNAKAHFEIKPDGTICNFGREIHLNTKV